MMKRYRNLGSLTWAKRESEMKATEISTFLIVAEAPEANIAALQTACGVFEHDSSCVSEGKHAAWNQLRKVRP